MRQHIFNNSMTKIKVPKKIGMFHNFKVFVDQCNNLSALLFVSDFMTFVYQSCPPKLFMYFCLDSAMNWL